MAAASATEVVERYELQDGASGEWKHTPGAYLVALGPSVYSPYLGAFRDLSSSPSLGTVELADPACGGRTICDVSASVVGREVVSVPAGKFDAIKVRVLHNWRGWRGATTAAGDGPGVSYFR